ncbi:glycosyltransferase family 4 protein [Serratia sp. UGAL515B_01]|uniref:glycosyltransferase family 4 protein n=1 Tax=Serratia sp. UGAL515B_01 TaxID=2986763 RepID=UPI002952AD39|nr:glycosyltransferase family 4 protein [Serratia sp. UGAL515B_01]WON76292.1 glycosyltransferase family 4 protein [Serratia sp. UGAL515B_01]
MKKITLLTTKYSDNKKDAWLTNELAYSLRDDGHIVSVVVFSWLPNEPETRVKKIDGINVVRVKLPKIMYNKNMFFTALKMFLFPQVAKWHVHKNIKECDLLITNTPCVTILGLSNFFKNKFNSKTYLVCWDFFPFYLKDLSLIRNKLVFKIFHYLEEKMYRSFSKIGCMTKGNINFLLKNFPTVDKDKIQVLPLWAKTKYLLPIDVSMTRKKYNLPQDATIVVYGGAMSVVQELTNYIDLARESLNLDKKILFLLIGNGTEKTKLEKIVADEQLDNVMFINYVPRDEYENVVRACDIGFISLSRKLTVPSFPSKSLDYFKASLPILASLDAVTDFGSILENEIKAGLSVLAGDTESLLSKLDILVSDRKLRTELGKAGRIYYENYLTVDYAKKMILET